MKLKSLIILALMSSPSFADVTEYVCPQPQFNSSAYHKNIIAFMVTIMGSKTASCGLYAEDINLTKDPNSVPIPHDDSSCIEIKCRAVNAKQIINNAKKIIALSNQALAEEKERSFSLITSQGEKKINKGIKQIEKILPDWENFIRKPYSDYTYQEAEKFIIRSLEVRTLNQVDLLPNATIQEYKNELQKIEEAKRLAAEKKRQEDERKRRLEQQQQAQQQKLLAAKEQQEYAEEMA
ncbi:MAG: hypothetical protein VYC67_04305, partial [Pseudomonadota bacterium]|nr:hypothetical protein [Pseudomonadota bacterium]